MSHEGKMRRGELYSNKNPTTDNLKSDVEYFKEQTKPVVAPVIGKRIEQMNKVELQKECTKQEKEFTDEMTKKELIELLTPIEDEE